MNASIVAAICFWLFASVIAPVRAQEPDATSASCERAWLASDWPTAAVDCSTIGFSHERSAEHMLAEAGAVSDPTITSSAKLVAGDARFIGAEAWARAAVAYAHLKKPNLADDARAKALADLQLVTDPQLAQRAAALTAFIQSDAFYADGADSPLLAHL